MRITASAQPLIRRFSYFSSQTYRSMTSQLRLMPDFLIIGGQRCGTSSLYYYLLDYPSIAPSYTKELHFFDTNFPKGLTWYRAQFPTSIQKYYTEHIRKHAFLTGEASPYYLFHPQAPKRAAQMLPHVKLIVLLRNPVDRAYSQHWLETYDKLETLPFEDAIASEEKRIAGERERMQKDEQYRDFKYRHHSYLARGIYVDQLQHWMSYYPKEQFLILRSEDLYSEPAGTVKQTLAFLGVPSTEIDTNNEYKQYKLPKKEGYNIVESRSEMSPAVRKYLIDYFKPHNARLSEFLGRNFDWDK